MTQFIQWSTRNPKTAWHNASVLICHQEASDRKEDLMDKIDLAGLIGCMVGFICGAGLMAIVGTIF